MRRMDGSVVRRFLLGLAPWVGAVLLWYGVRWSGFINNSLIPAPHQVAAKFVELLMYEGVSQITPLYIRVAQTLGAGEFEIFRKVIIPLTVPHILTALRVALGVAWATLVASELIAAQRGLGAMIQNASTYFLLDVIYVGIICIGCVALIMDLILRRISARLLIWQERAVA